MANYLITGSSRGLGLSMASELASMPARQVGTIFATARSESSVGLQKLVKNSSGRVVFVKLDATSKSSVREAAAHIGQMLEGKGLDVLINNAGMMNYTPDGIQTMNDLDTTFNTNVMSAHLVTSAFLELLQKGTLKKVFNISTTLGSISMAPTYKLFPVPAYKVSKAALNMLTVQYAQAYEAEGFTFITISPGWLQTDLGGASADLPAEKGAKAVLEAVHNYGREHNGKFFNIHVAGWEKNEGLNQYDGGTPPW